MAFCDDLRHAMSVAGIKTQAALADLTGIRQPSICRYLQGGVPQLSHLEVLEYNLPVLRELRETRLKLTPPTHIDRTVKLGD